MAPAYTVRPVRVAVAEGSESGATRGFSGQTRAPADSRLSFRVSGIIVRMEVGVGEPLKAGQLVAALDPQDYQIEVREAEAMLLRAEAEERNAAAEYRRTRALYAEDKVSLSAFDAARAAARTTAAMAEAARERAGLARQRLTYVRLVAPRSGFVTDELAQVGEYVQPGQPIVGLASAGRLEVEALVPEGVVGALRVGTPATVRLPTVATSPLDAEVTEVGVAPRQGEAGFPVVLRFRSAPEMLRPGLAAQVAFKLDAPSNAGATRVVVPTVAVAEDFDGRFVYVVEPRDPPADAAAASAAGGSPEPPAQHPGDGVIVRRTVQTGELTEGGLEILRGVAPGELVVTAGLSQLQEGDPVRLPPEVRSPSDSTDEGLAMPSPPEVALSHSE